VKAALAICLLLPCVAAHAASNASDWPCQQIRQPELSIASIWTGPPIEEKPQEEAITDLAHRIAQRRLPLEQAQEEIVAFARQAGESRKKRLTALFAELFDIMNRERSSIVAGLGRFGVRQKQLAEAIRAENEALQAERASTTPDPARLNDLTQRLTWDLKLFQDRREALGSACNAPTLVEQRLFALARSIQQAIETSPAPAP
jgi:hypothetical protein